MAERGRYVHEAARFKADPTHVEVPAQEVFAKASAAGQTPWKK